MNRATGAKVYSAANRLTVVAPMPGLDADGILVSLAGDVLTIETANRPEVRVGLPRSVDAAAAIAAYAYGVLVVSLPLADPGGEELDVLGPGLVKQSHSRAEGAPARSRRPAG